MDSFLLSDSELNLRFYRSNLCSQYRQSVYELISKPQGISEERYTTTSCGLTAELIRYLLSGTTELKTPWVETYEPNSDTLYILADGGDHEFVITDGKIYDSWWNIHRLSIREVPEEMLNNIRVGNPFTFVRGSDKKEFEYEDYYCLELDNSLINMEEVKERYKSIITFDDG